MKKNKGFTLIEIIAVIIILGIVTLIMIPSVNVVIESGKKNVLKATANNILKAVKQECEIQKMDNINITKNYTITNGEISSLLEVDNLPENGSIFVDDNCQASIAITDNGYCVIADSDGTVVNTNTLHCEAEYLEIPETVNDCFIFDDITRTITGYDYNNASCPTDISIPASINDVPVEHIADFAFVAPDYEYILIDYDNLSEIDYTTTDVYYNTDIIQNVDIDSQEFKNAFIPIKNINLNVTKWCYNAINDEVSERLLDYVTPAGNEYDECYINEDSFGSEKPYDVARGLITGLNLSKATNLISIGDGAFMYNSIEDIYFGNLPNLSYIGVSAFLQNVISGRLNLSNLTNIDVLSSSAFSSNNISQVDLPSNLKDIGYAAFADNNLPQILLPSGLEKIHSYSFSYNYIHSLIVPETVTFLSGFSNNDISDIEIPTSVTKIGQGAFEENSLSDINIPSNVEIIDAGAFYENEISTLALNEGLEYIGDYAFARCDCEENENRISTLTIPATVTTIGEGAFQINSISSLTLKNGLESIGAYAFYNNDLISLTTPSSLKRIDASAFESNLLTTLNLNEELTNVGIYAFADGRGTTISNLTLPNSWTVIPTGLFAYNKINNLVIGNNVVTIKDEAFNHSKIKTIVWGNSITTIEKNAFHTCAFETFSLPPNIQTIGGGAFTWAFEDISDITVTIPDAITVINYSVFYGMSGKNLETIDTGKNVTKMGSSAFYGSSGDKLTKIVIGSKVTSIASNAFVCSNATKCDYIFEIKKNEGSINNYPWGNTYASAVWTATE